LGYQKYK